MKVKNLIILSSILLCFIGVKSQNTTWKNAVETKKAEINIFYFENEPFSYVDNKSQLIGIEIDILNYFKTWLKETKNIEINYNYLKSKNFQSNLKTLAAGDLNSIGASTVSITEQRKETFNFSAPYLKNISVLISHGDVPTLSSADNFESSFSDLVPVTIQGSIHEGLLKTVITESKGNISPEYVDRPQQILELIAKNPKYYGYVDILNYWKFVKNQPSNIKMHKKANVGNQFLGYILPKKSDWNEPLNEFFESGFGFTSTKAYREILEKYLGYEVIDFVEMD